MCVHQIAFGFQACPSSQTYQTWELKIKRVLFLLPARHVYVPGVHLGVERELHTSECLFTSQQSTGHQFGFPNSLSSMLTKSLRVTTRAFPE